LAALRKAAGYTQAESSAELGVNIAAARRIGAQRQAPVTVVGESAGKDFIHGDVPVVIGVSCFARCDWRVAEGDIHHGEAALACRRHATRAAGISSQSMDPSALRPGVRLHPSPSLAWVFVAVGCGGAVCVGGGVKACVGVSVAVAVGVFVGGTGPPMNRPKALGNLPTGTLAVTVLVAVSMTETALFERTAT
jgi:hypothetical protein